MPRSTPSGIWQVAVPGPFSGPLDYLPPRQTLPCLPGVRVRVGLGRREVVGVVTGTIEGSALGVDRLKPVLQVLDDEPVLNDALFRLLRWSADYYHHPLGEILHQALPVLLRQGRDARRPGLTAYRLDPEVAPMDLSRAPRQAALAEHLAGHPQGLTPTELDALPPGQWQGPLRALRQKGYVETVVREASSAPPAPEPGPALNADQEAVVEALRAGLEGFGCFLLQGVTGSGKTEVYLHLIRAVLDRGRQCLVLAPEIALTPQLVRRFSRRLGARVVVLHSGLTDAERLDAWLAAREGDADVVIGTRSAVFVPLARPGIIIVDEEHDGSFKQHEGFRYHARDVAVMRARMEGLTVLLGSATPSLESLANAARGQYQRLSLTKRAGQAAAPHCQLLDLRRQTLDEGLSTGLLQHMEQHLHAGGQCLLFLNRRGYAPTLLCHDCGWVADCPRCDARMTWHRGDGRIRCHHCGHERPRPPRCPECGGALGGLGEGTERVSEALERHFPGIPIGRLDRDSTRRKGALESVLNGVRDGTYRILVGTQMLAKGHHFPEVSLVGILDADQGLFSADFRAAERMAQLIIQVAGRAGRAERPGEVTIQTHHPEHPLLQTLVSGGYEAFAHAALEERRLAGLPPYASLAVLRAEAATAEAPFRFLETARSTLRALGAADIQIWGPAPALMERRAGRHRAQLLIQSPSRPALHRALRQWAPGLGALPGARKVRWALDVDALEV